VRGWDGRGRGGRGENSPRSGERASSTRPQLAHSFAFVVVPSRTLGAAGNGPTPGSAAGTQGKAAAAGGGQQKRRGGRPTGKGTRKRDDRGAATAAAPVVTAAAAPSGGTADREAAAEAADVLLSLPDSRGIKRGAGNGDTSGPPKKSR
jgi:hypothetical protein